MKSVYVEGQENRRDTSTLRGVLAIDGDQVVLRRAEHEISFHRDRIISIAGGRQRERDYWSGTLSMGMNARAGNTDTLDTTVQAMIRRRTARTRIQADYLANYSETQNVETADDQRLTVFHDWFLTGRFYWKVVDAEFSRDPFSNIAGQYSIATGLGYDIIQKPHAEWTVNTGAGYQELRFVSVQPGEDQSSSSPFFTAGTRMDLELTKSVDFLYDYSLRVLNEDNGQYTHQMKATLSFDLIGDLDVDVSAIWDRIEKPQLDENNVLPEQDDYQLIVSIAYDF
jgi:putative salt-induced outer membrane protein YdiY